MLSQMARFPSFLWLDNIPVCVCDMSLYHNFFSLSIHPTGGHPGHFHALAFINIAMNIRVQIYIEVTVFIFLG